MFPTGLQKKIQGQHGNLLKAPGIISWKTSVRLLIADSGANLIDKPSYNERFTLVRLDP